MKFVEISNVGSVRPLSLVLVGLGDKRTSVDDKRIIGNKHSGTKFAPIAACQLGISLRISSHDSHGPFAMTYEVCDIDESGERTWRLVANIARIDGRVERRPTDFTVDAMQDWSKPIGDDLCSAFKLVSQYLVNAKDEFERAGAREQDRVRVRKVNFQIWASPGRVVVHLQLTPAIEIMLFTHPERYFKWLSPTLPLYVDDEVGEIYPKSEEGRMRLFGQGVLVHCERDLSHPSIFDYSLNKKSLVSEERTLAGTEQFRAELGRLFAAMRDRSIALTVVHAIIGGTAKFEEQVLGEAYCISEEDKEFWRGIVREAYCREKICVPCQNRDLENDVEQMHGYMVLSSTRYYFQTFLLRIGIPRADNVCPRLTAADYRMVEIAALTEQSRRDWVTMLTAISAQYPEFINVPMRVFLVTNPEFANYEGLAPRNHEGKITECWVAAVRETPAGVELPKDLVEIVERAVHEFRHFETQAGDFERKLVNRADRREAILILRLSGRDERGKKFTPIASTPPAQT